MSNERVNETTMGRHFAKVIREGCEAWQVRGVIDEINALSRAHRANRAAIIMACAQILGQNISGEPEVAKEMRAAILELVDGFAMHSATLEV